MNARPTYLIGDLHGALTFFSKSPFDLNESFDMYILGDIGFGFSQCLDDVLFERCEHYVNSLGCSFYFIRGNHDDPSYWKEKNLNQKGITFLKDNTIVTINNKKYLAVGGGVSIDYLYRAVNKDYWENEDMVILDEYPKDIHGILSHTGPVPPTINKLIFKDDKFLNDKINREYDSINKLMELIKPSEWYYAHYHTHSVFNINNCKCHVLDIEEVIEIN